MPFTVTMPKLSPTMQEGIIAKWHKKEGEFVKAGDLLVEIATDKATVEYDALDEGWLRKQLVAEGAMAVMNQPIALFTEKQDEDISSFKLETPKKEETVAPEATKEDKKEMAETKSKTSLGEPAFTPEPPLEDYDFEFPRESAEKRVKASPLAKKQAKEKNLDLTSVKGSGPGGRISLKDLAKAQTLGEASPGRYEAPTLPPGTYEEVPLTPMRKVIAKRLQEAKTFIPHFYVEEKIEVSKLAALREQLAAHGIKVSYNDFLIKAVSLALRKHPNVNAGFNSVTQAAILFKTIDIAVAVSVEGGLLTPVLRHADYKSVAEIAAEVKTLADKARAGKLLPEEYKGGSFTISNLGMYGISAFSAVLNPPQAAILAVGGIKEEPVVKDGAIVVGKTLVLTLSADHRVIDGATAAQFLKTLGTFLDNPAILLV